MSKVVKPRPEIVGKKLGMTKVFNEDGVAYPVTVIELAENIITEVRTPEKHGYAAVQIGSVEKKEKHLTKAQIENLKKKNLPLLSHLKEFRINDADVEKYKVGEKINVEELLVPNNKCDVTGKSIGKGFQGMVKLHNIARGPRSHGSKSYRQPGSIGAGTSPGRVFPGKKMPSRMGNEQVTTRNLKIIDFNKEENVVLVEGAVPGNKGSLVVIKPSLDKKKWNIA